MVTKNNINIDTLDAFTRAYIECALWSSTDRVNGEDVNLDAEHSIEDIAQAAIETMLADCAKFQAENEKALNHAYQLLHDNGGMRTLYHESQAGHDFWLTRCGHGAGFWDRGLGEIGEKLTTACKSYGSIDLYIGEDGAIHA